MMSDQNFDNKDKVEILPNGVKVIWQFYKPKKEKASDPQSSDKSLEDSKDSYGNRASAGKRAGTKSSSRSGYSARGRAGASGVAGAGSGGKSSYKSTAYKSKKSTQEPTAYSGFAKENHHYDNETKFNHSQFNAAANQSGNDFYANNRAVSKQSRTSQNSYSRANQPSTNNDYMANNYQGYGQGSVLPAQAQATAPAIATASANARASTPNSLQVAPNNSTGYSPNYSQVANGNRGIGVSAAASNSYGNNVERGRIANQDFRANHNASHGHGHGQGRTYSNNSAGVTAGNYQSPQMNNVAFNMGNAQPSSAVNRAVASAWDNKQAMNMGNSYGATMNNGQAMGQSRNMARKENMVQGQATGYNQSNAGGRGQNMAYAQGQGRGMGQGQGLGQGHSQGYGYGQGAGQRSGQGAVHGTVQGAGQEERKGRLDELSGLLERVTYHNEETGYCVLRIKVKGETDLITVVGHASSVTPGEYVTAHGFWVFSKEYGRQFKAERIDVYPPTTLDGIERYLGSGMVKGVGPKTAKILVDAYGENVFDIIEQDPKAMLDLHGIGQKRANKIASGWADQKVIRSIMVFLHSHGVSTSKSVLIFKKYGSKAIEVVQENPYCLAKDIRGIGFKSADTIASKIGIGAQSPLRAQAGVAFALSEASSNDGHCCLPRSELIKLAQELLNIPEPIINDAIEHEIADGELTQSNFPTSDSIFLSSLYRSEQRIAQSLKELMEQPLPWPEIKEDIALDWVEKKLSINLADSQKQAVKTALHSKVMVITGGPGVGKTTIVKAILKILAAKNVDIKLCAPTGRAAKRLSESSGYEATTIHRMLEVDPSTMEFKYNDTNPLTCDLLVVDECSMVDIPLANNLLKAVPRHAAVIFVGDIDQLPSVGPGAFLGDLIASELIPVIRLTEVFRQAATSWIIRIAHEINKGYLPRFPTKEDKGDCYFVNEEDRERLPQTLVNLVQNRLPKAYGYDPIKDIQVLCPMNRGDSGARALNMMLQQALNTPDEHSITKFGVTFSVGDKVMQIENNYDRDVYNGDLGFVQDIDLQEQELLVDFDGRSVAYPFSELDELVLSYACTIHKSQGSEYPVVVIPLTMQHFMMLKRNLIYTGVTRGKKLVVIVGEKKALNMAVKDWRTKERNSGLKDAIKQKLFDLELNEEHGGMTPVQGQLLG